MLRFQAALLSAAFLGLTTVGCGGGGPALGEVSGTVTVDGEPAPGVNVTFQPAEGGRGSTATTNENGEYELIYSPSSKGALLGEHTVTITGGEPGFDDVPTGGEMLVEGSSIPSEYLGMKKTVTVESGSNTHDISYP